MTKQKCPFCQKEVSDMSKHLVLSHNIKDIDHLRTLTIRNSLSDDTILKTPLSKTEMRSETVTKGSIRKEILKMAIKIRGEQRIRALETHIQRMGFFLSKLPEDIDVFNEGLDALLSCLGNQNSIVNKWTLEELEKILDLSILDGESEQKIRSSINSYLATNAKE